MFGADTVADPTRCIGNVSVTTSLVGDVVGYENHSGRTYLDSDQEPFGVVRRGGGGNNGRDRTEGAVRHNVVGTYLHGSLLPKNPALADTIIGRAAVRRHGRFEPAHIDDSLAHRARAVAAVRPR